MSRGTENRGLANRGTANRGIGIRGIGKPSGRIPATSPSLRPPLIVAQPAPPNPEATRIAAEALIRFFENVLVQHERGTSELGKRSRPGLKMSAEEARRLHGEWTKAYHDMLGRLSQAGLAPMAEPLRIAYTRAAQALDSAVRPAVRREQVELEAMVEELAQHYQKSFGARRSKAARVGRKIDARVLTDLEYETAKRREAARQHEQSVRAVLRFDPKYAKSRLKDLYAYESLPARVQNVHVGMQLTTAEAFAIVAERSGEPQSGAGFYSASQGKFFVRVGHVSLAVAAHELGHAYAHPKWDQALLKIFGLSKELAVWDIDEALTSEVADAVLASHHDATTSGPVKLGVHPSGYVGHGPEVRRAGRVFLHAVEGKLSPGRTTLEAFFEGAIIVENGADPIVRFGNKRKPLRLSRILVL